MPILALNWLIDLDHALFAKINLDWTNSFFDWFFPNITDLHKDPRSLIVLLPLLAFWFWRQRARALKWFLITVLSVAISDTVAFRLIKNNVGRDRPQFSGVEYNLRTHEHTGPSFPSNHASNAFAAATALTGAFPPCWPLFYFVAFLIAYSRVYVGVHFPLDVFCGAVLGTLIGYLVRLALRWWTLPPKQEDFGTLADSVIKNEAKEKTR